MENGEGLYRRDVVSELISKMSDAAVEIGANYLEVIGACQGIMAASTQLLSEAASVLVESVEAASGAAGEHAAPPVGRDSGESPGGKIVDSPARP